MLRRMKKEKEGEVRGEKGVQADCVEGVRGSGKRK